ncbi:helix-turn-helix domain-containing protein [Streptomyces sp. NBC_01267]|uniref:hypothetical protein n=1 Tax=Streptomyces sp. NBC_01267 TaxID=2903805 RepID=UPI002E320237|nr:hypothetical protein [Streptomyces sp. NBC_01267]
MLRHVIAPSGRYTKASHDVVRHPRLSSDAKILLLYIQGLPEGAAHQPLGELAQRLGIKGRAFQKAKGQLVEHGYVHEWRSQNDRGRWVTEQLLTNLPLTAHQALGLREADDAPVTGPAAPSAHIPAVGAPRGRVAGGYEPVEEHCEKTTPHPPSEAVAAGRPVVVEEPAPVPGPELAAAEAVLLSLRHSNRELHLGVREARALAADAAQWLLRGVPASDLRRVLLAELPADGVRSAVGFLRHRLVQKLPDASPPVASGVPQASAGLITCEGPGDDHAFRPVGGETVCPACRRAAALAQQRHPRTEAVAGASPQRRPWRERLAVINAQSGRGLLDGG